MWVENIRNINVVSCRAFQFEELVCIIGKCFATYIVVVENSYFRVPPMHV